MLILHFDQVEVGDKLTFQTRDNGFGGSGGFIDRDGVVFRKTDKVVDLTVDGGIGVFKNGKNRIEGGTARLRKADWYDRQVRRSE